MSLKIKYWIFLTLIILCVLVNFAGFMNGIDWGDDFASYIIQAQTLVDGNFKGLEENIKRNDFILCYPWGFPIILAPVIKCFGTDLVIIKKTTFLFFIISLSLTYLLFRRREKEQVLFAILLVAVSPYFWYFKNYIFSDFPNMCFVLLSLLLMWKILVKKEKILNPWLDNCLIGIAVYLSFTMRTQSFILLITLAILQVIYLKRELLKPKTLLKAVSPYVIFIVLKLILETIIPVKVISYSETFGSYDWLGTVCNNIFYYINVWEDLFKEILHLQKIDGVITGICIFLCINGLCINWKENLVYIIFAGCQIGLLLVFPSYQNLRYLTPLIPLFFYFLVAGTCHLLSVLSQNKGRLYAYLFLGSLTAFSINTIATLSYSNLKTPFTMDGPCNASARELFDFLKKRTPEKSIIGFFKPRVILLYSGRNGVVPQNIDECMKRNVNYYVYYSKADTDQIPLDSITSRPKLFKKIFENPNHQVFKVITRLEDEKDNSIGGFVLKIDADYFKTSVTDGSVKLIGVWGNEAVTSSDFALQKGNYSLSICSRGTQAGGEYPLNSVILNNKILGTYRSLEQPSNINFSFAIAADTTATIKIKLENDLSKDGEDRNTLVYFINIYRE